MIHNDILTRSGPNQAGVPAKGYPTLGFNTWFKYDEVLTSHQLLSSLINKKFFNALTNFDYNVMLRVNSQVNS